VIAGAGRVVGRLDYMLPQGAANAPLTGSATSANGSTKGTHPRIGPNFTKARTLFPIARPLIGGHGAPGSRYGSVTQARQMRDTPVTAGKLGIIPVVRFRPLSPLEADARAGLGERRRPSAGT
jgi:hypothetical protein